VNPASDSFVRRMGVSVAPHWRVFTAFFLYAFSLGGLFPRLPDIRTQMGIGESALGLALIGISVGTMTSLTLIVPKVERFGHRRLLLVLLPITPIFFAVASHMQTPMAMFAALFFAGLVIGCIETFVNLEADRVEHQLKRRIMNRSHAFWSFGFFAAGTFSAAVTHWGLSPQLQLWASVLIVAVLTVVLLGKFDAAPARTSTAPEQGTSRWVSPTKGIVLLVGVCASALLLEGAGFDWSAIYMRDVFNSEAAFAATAVSTVALAQAITRFLADGFVQRFGPVRVVRLLLVVLLAGTTLVSFAPAPWYAMTGFALLGIGSSAVFPLAMSAAAQRTDRSSTINVAAMAQYGFIIFLLAPPTLGFIAEHAGVRWSYGVAIPLIFLSLMTSHALASKD
jgi:MFS family permease